MYIDYSFQFNPPSKQMNLQRVFCSCHKTGCFQKILYLRFQSENNFTECVFLFLKFNILQQKI